MSRRLDCETTRKRLESSLDGELDARAAAAVEVHLEGCPGCAAELELASRIRAELRSWPELDAPPGVLRRVFHRVGAERFAGAREEPPRPVHGRPAWTALAAAAMVTVVLGVGLYLTDREDAPAAIVTAPPELAGELDPAEIARATEEARLALAYFARASRRTGLKVRDEVLLERLVKPSADTFSRAFRPLGVSAPETADGGEDRS